MHVQELIQMEVDNDWSNLNIPIRIEMIPGKVMDSLNTNDIQLKHA
jgi:hypothetical protein